MITHTQAKKNKKKKPQNISYIMSLKNKPIYLPPSTPPHLGVCPSLPFLPPH